MILDLCHLIHEVKNCFQFLIRVLVAMFSVNAPAPFQCHHASFS